MIRRSKRLQSTNQEIKIDKVVTKQKMKKVIPKANKAKLSMAIQRQSFIPKYNIDEAWNALKIKDPKLAIHMDEVALQDFKDKLSHSNKTNSFRALTNSIIFQQIHGKAAASIRNRFIRLFDPPTPFPEEMLTATYPWFPTPAMILEKSIEEMRGAGLSQRKSEYIRELASKFNDNTITEDKLNSLDDADISKLLCSIRGIGQWTVDMFLMFNLCHPDVLPTSDLGVQRGVGIHFGVTSTKPSSKPNSKKPTNLPSPKEMKELSCVWTPYRTIASWMMWRIQDVTTMHSDLSKDDEK
ncbi:DNA glycosylase [Hesseltinella vesiculosa]|uniref:DNA glycosylase n=1 Tax=Hesseltinella vesiculosa TaxID=101127 RepID=A0A1X2GDJ3_9FUNG|nr:DNA glycosylase [Hesseltinella vesiculosa]